MSYSMQSCQCVFCRILAIAEVHRRVTVFTRLNATEGRKSTNNNINNSDFV